MTSCFFVEERITIAPENFYKTQAIDKCLFINNKAGGKRIICNNHELILRSADLSPTELLELYRKRNNLKFYSSEMTTFKVRINGSFHLIPAIHSFAGKKEKPHISEYFIPLKTNKKNVSKTLSCFRADGQAADLEKCRKILEELIKTDAFSHGKNPFKRFAVADPNVIPFPLMELTVNDPVFRITPTYIRTSSSQMSWDFFDTPEKAQKYLNILIGKKTVVKLPCTVADHKTTCFDGYNKMEALYAVINEVNRSILVICSISTSNRFSYELCYKVFKIKRDKPSKGPESADNPSKD
ncbi:hypothetical protein KKF97_17795 [Myxococcota bacterium]|nr:hypothetical protein [Myxococcota bacterium]MBU1502654.1 hypothetical protein [bacterium]